jgi:hypothetical protein
MSPRWIESNCIPHALVGRKKKSPIGRWGAQFFRPQYPLRNAAEWPAKLDGHASALSTISRVGRALLTRVAGIFKATPMPRAARLRRDRAFRESSGLDTAHQTGEFGFGNVVLPDLLDDGILAPAFHHALGFILIVYQHRSQ